MLPPSVKRKLRDIHTKLTLIDVYLCAMKDRGPPFGPDEIAKIEEDLHRETKRIYGILDPPYRKGK